MHTSTAVMKEAIKLSLNSSSESAILRFSKSYGQVHGWTSAFTCLFGIPCNLLNIIVLTQPNMIKSPTNLILVGLAITDLITMILYLPTSIYFYILYGDLPHPHPQRDTFIWTHFHKIFTMCAVTFHSISIWLTVYLAAYRYISLKTASPSNQRPKSNKLLAIKKAFAKFFVQCRSSNSTILCMILITLFNMLICLPAYLYPQVTSAQWDPSDNQDNLNISKNANHTGQIYYLIDQSELATRSNGTLWKSMVYSQAILAKLVPCLLLTTFTALLINSLVLINKNKKKLDKMSMHKLPKKKKDKTEKAQSDSPPIDKPGRKLAPAKRNRATENLRTTLMLIVVCVLFLLTELPQCLTLILSLVLSKQFFIDVYMPLGDIFDMIALLNNSINFLLYCTMSKSFRDTFYMIISNYFGCLCKPEQARSPRMLNASMKLSNNSRLPREQGDGKDAEMVQILNTIPER